MKLLLDSHVPKAVAAQLRRRSFDIVHLSEWLGGAHRDSADAVILGAASADGRVLITCDEKTMPNLAIALAEHGLHHAGIALVSDRTIDAADVGALVRSLLNLLEHDEPEEWVDRITYLKR